MEKFNVSAKVKVVGITGQLSVVFFLLLSSHALSDSCLSVDDCVCVYSGSLQISAAIQTDEGKYECVAQNSAGIAYAYPANLAVHGTCSSSSSWSLNCHLIFVGFMVYL